MTKIFYDFFDKSISTYKHVISKKKHKKSKEKNLYRETLQQYIMFCEKIYNYTFQSP
jgi:hypothetical protein